ncbi:MAG: response regulator [Marinagarivorans sp.]|nr:response regulator [Marinagarivorans sp.]
MSATVLLVEDEAVLAESLTVYLQRDNYLVHWVADGANVIERFKQTKPDLVLLDLMLPNVDGLTLCREIRKLSDAPIIMLTARVDEIDRLIGLEIGADDYICKPYSPREVVARVRAVLRRYLISVGAGAQAVVPDVRQSQLVIDEKSMDAFWGNHALQLTTVEFRLLQTMAIEPRRVFSRDQLMDRIYPDHRVVSDRTIDAHITKLRRKFTDANCHEEVIRAVYGAGYKFEHPF